MLDGLSTPGDLIDTADVYSPGFPATGGESETIIGDWLSPRGNRARMIAPHQGRHATWATERKGLGVGRWIMQRGRGFAAPAEDRRDRPVPGAQDDPETPLEETLAAFAELIKAGKVRAIGASNYERAGLAGLQTSARLGLPRYETLQPAVQPVDRAGFEAALAPLWPQRARRDHLLLRLASGFLSGKYRSEADFGKSKRGGGMTSI